MAGSDPTMAALQAAEVRRLRAALEILVPSLRDVDSHREASLIVQ
jgi:hypothetical protein